MKCSAVVLSHNRVGNLGRILENLQRHSWIDDIILWHQGERLDDDFPGIMRVRTFRSSVNRHRMGRFAAMDYCNHDAVLVQDDDTLTHNLGDAWKAWQADQSRIVTLLANGHLMSDDRRHWGECHEVLLGWGAIVDRRWQHVFSLWRHRYGDDGLLQRKADRIFSILQQRPHTVIRARYDNLPGANDAMAVWKEPGHDAATVEARGRCLNGILGLGVSEKKYRRR